MLHERLQPQALQHVDTYCPPVDYNIVVGKTTVRESFPEWESMGFPHLFRCLPQGTNKNKELFGGYRC